MGDWATGLSSLLQTVLFTVLVGERRSEKTMALHYSKTAHTHVRAPPDTQAILAAPAFIPARAWSYSK